MKNYIPTIGLEIHAELNTKTKMFCGCKNDPFASAPNTNVCPTCLGLPGSLPVPNKQAILDTIKIGKALGSKIAIATKWDRKHYFYPDLPKSFQISQFDQPICEGGRLPAGDGQVELTRVHLEEDTGKLTHPQGADYSLIDLNRAGVPLVELVTQPVIHDGKVARKFCEEYQLVLRTLGVSNADMEKGEMRCEVNISLCENHKTQDTNSKQTTKQTTNSKSQILNQKLGTKVEIKNLNSFRSVEKSIEYEIKRQTEILGKGEKITQETRGWNDAKQKTYSQRVKETSADYRYFPEPDIPPIETSELLKEIGKIPEMPWDKRGKFIGWGLAEKDAQNIVSNLKMSEFFEQASYNTNDKKILANLLINDAPEMKITPNDLALLANIIDSGGINRTIAKEIISGIYQCQQICKLFAEYKIINSSEDIGQVVRQVIGNNPCVVAKIKAGKINAIAFLIGQVMIATRGRAEAEKVKEIIKGLI